MDTITIRMPDDFHVHFREGELLRRLAYLVAQQFGRAIAMPNTLNPPIRTVDDAIPYRDEILMHSGNGFQPLMTLKLYPDTTPEVVRGAHAAGVVAVKYYPEGVTTNAEDGVSVGRLSELYPAFEAMQDIGMLLLLHGEMPGVFCLDREAAFLEVLRRLCSDFPGLKIVLDHITTAGAVEAVYTLPATVAATITLHHLELTLDDVIGDKIMPHNFCKPVVKRPQDREALCYAVTSGNPKFFFGSDSAPHPICAKECAEGCAGVFTAPVAMPRLMEFFETLGCLTKLDPFVSQFGAEFYGLPLNQGTLTLVREPWIVPVEYAGVRPYLAGRTIIWRIAE